MQSIGNTKIYPVDLKDIEGLAKANRQIWASVVAALAQNGQWHKNMLICGGTSAAEASKNFVSSFRHFCHFIANRTLQYITCIFFETSLCSFYVTMKFRELTITFLSMLLAIKFRDSSGQFRDSSEIVPRLFRDCSESVPVSSRNCSRNYFPLKVPR